MKRENIYFKVLPKIVKADKQTTIEIRPLYDHCKFDMDKQYEITYFPMDSFTRKEAFIQKPSYFLKPEDGVLKVSEYFEGEQEHRIYVNEILKDNTKKQLGEFRIYSLEDDLFNKTPYKGDIHMHSYHSDGKEAPAYVAACCRKIGLDFMAITDHHKYFPSIEAQNAYENVALDMKIYRGEEVHAPGNPVHIINFGGSFSVNETFQNDEELYKKEVAVFENTVTDFPTGATKFQYASSLWVYDKIHQGGGLGLFCHPYWRIYSGYTPSTILTKYMFEKQPFDAFELIGGYDGDEIESNQLQLAFYQDERSKGREIPIVGVSDAHGCEHNRFFGWYYTLVFSPTLELEDLISNIKNLNSVAIEAIPGENIRVHGPFRLVKYAYFLLRELLPLHDELCFEEGSLMQKYIAGDEKAGANLERLKGQTKVLLKQYWDKI